MPTIEETAASLRDKHMPPSIRPFTGSPTTMLRGSETMGSARGGGRPAPTRVPVVGSAAPGKPARRGGAPAATPAPAKPADAQPWRSHPAVQPLPVKRDVFRSIEPIAGHIHVRVQAGKRAMRAAKYALGDIIANGINGFPVRVFQSTREGVSLMSRSDDHAAGKDPVAKQKPETPAPDPGPVAATPDAPPKGG